MKSEITRWSNGEIEIKITLTKEEFGELPTKKVRNWRDDDDDEEEDMTQQEDGTKTKNLEDPTKGIELTETVVDDPIDPALRPATAKIKSDDDKETDDDTTRTPRPAQYGRP